MNLIEYYSNKEVQKVLLEKSKNREITAQFNESFGKRPDMLQFENDISEMVKKGATSFHMSEEHWSNPLLLKPGMSKRELDELRIGWDLILDIDGPIELSKITAYLLLEALEFNDVKNYTIKFSGNKGFHIAIPFKAFPEKIPRYNIKTKDSFPEGPRIITSYLKGIIKSELKKEISKFSIEELINLSKKSKKDITHKKCKKCNIEAIEEDIIKSICKNKNCGREDTIEQIECPDCKSIREIKKIKNIKCPNCKTEKQISDRDISRYFRDGEISEYSLVDIDTILISSRHMFRAPYSSHEKSKLISIPIKKEDILKFNKESAKPENVKFNVPFLSDCKEGEASRLIEQAFSCEFERNKRSNEEEKQEIRIHDDFSEKISSEFFPDSIKKGLQGLKDGKKRFLFVLLNFLKYLNYDYDEIKKIVEEWNKKNDEPLKEGYVNSQLLWHKRQKRILPPNFTNKLYYMDIGINVSEREMKFKNPVNFAIRMFKLKHH